MKEIDKIKKYIDSIKEIIVNDGGDMKFVSFKSNILTLKVTGACATCQFKDQTFEEGIKMNILMEFPKLKDVKFIF